MTRKLPLPVIIVGLVSLLNELSSQIVAPLIPILLATTTAEAPIALGLVEDVADAIASFVRLWAGHRSDLLGGKRKDSDRGTVFGWDNMIVGLATVPAGLLFGVLWQQFGAGIAFAGFGAIGLLCASLILWLLPLLLGRASRHP